MALLLTVTASADDQEQLKKDVRAVMMRLQFIPPPERKELEARGDVVAALIDIIQEEEATGEEIWGNSMCMQIALSSLAVSTDPRARAVFLQYLPLAEALDPRWQEAVGYLLRNRDSEGEEWIRSYLQEGRNAEAKRHLVNKIEVWGDVHWLDKLKSIPVSSEDEKWGLPYWLGKATEEFERDKAEQEQAKKSGTPPDGPGKETKVEPSNDPFPPRNDPPIGPANRPNAVHDQQPADADRTGLVPLACVLAAGACLLLIRRRFRRPP